MAKGFYQTVHPIDGSYIDQMIITIAMPRGNNDLRKRIATGLILVLGKLGISHSGSITPTDALKLQQKQEG